MTRVRTTMRRWFSPEGTREGRCFAPKSLAAPQIGPLHQKALGLSGWVCLLGLKLLKCLLGRFDLRGSGVPPVFATHWPGRMRWVWVMPPETPRSFSRHEGLPMGVWSSLRPQPSWTSADAGSIGRHHPRRPRPRWVRQSPRPYREVCRRAKAGSLSQTKDRKTSRRTSFAPCLAAHMSHPRSPDSAPCGTWCFLGGWWSSCSDEWVENPSEARTEHQNANVAPTRGNAYRVHPAGRPPRNRGEIVKTCG